MVKVKREKIREWLECPICKKLMKEPTSINHCFHTFCKECISNKMITEKLDSCPVCKTHLGAKPLDTLRADQFYEDLKNAILSGIKKSEQLKPAEEAFTALTVGNKSEKLEVDCQRPKRGRPRKSNALTIQEPVKANNQNPEKKQNNPDDGHPKKKLPPRKGKEITDMWKPLNFLAGMTSSSHPGADTLAHSSIDDENQKLRATGETKVHGHLQKGATAFGASSRKEKALMEVGTKQIWISLVAAGDDQKPDQLPQKSYLRAKDPCMPISIIHKYIAGKLELKSEEVEIELQGQIIKPTFLLEEVLDVWLRSMPESTQLSTTVGSSAERFLMAFNYRKKKSPP